MEVTVLEEHGREAALRGMSYSFKDRAEDLQTWWSDKFDRAVKRAMLLAGKGGGHDKFLRQIYLWVDVEAPRAFWQEFDTYGVGVVRQSESTMHTLQKRPPTFDDFEEGTSHRVVQAFIEDWPNLKHDVTKLKEALPEGYLQRRMVTMNYENIQNIKRQRLEHRYKRWQQFLDQLLEQIKYPEYIK